MLKAFRADPGKIANAARKAGVARKTARRCWQEGWAARSMPSAQDVLEHEKELARARRAQAERGEIEYSSDAVREQAMREMTARLQARDDAVEARRQEGQMVKLARSNTISMMASASRLIRAADEKAKGLREDIEKGSVSMTPTQTITFIRDCAYLAKAGSEATKLNLEVERLLMGQPTEILGVNLQHMTPEDVVRAGGMVNRAMRRAEKKGLIPPASDVPGYMGPEDDEVN
jgi:hypothetical protein